MVRLKINDNIQLTSKTRQCGNHHYRQKQTFNLMYTWPYRPGHAIIMVRKVEVANGGSFECRQHNWQRQQGQVYILARRHSTQIVIYHLCTVFCDLNLVDLVGFDNRVRF